MHFIFRKFNMLVQNNSYKNDEKSNLILDIKVISLDMQLMSLYKLIKMQIKFI